MIKKLAWFITFILLFSSISCKGAAPSNGETNDENGNGSTNGSETVLPTQWYDVEWSSIDKPQGQHISITDNGGLASEDGEISLGGGYDYHIEAGQPDIYSMSGKVTLVGSSNQSSILVWSYGGFATDPELPSVIKQRYNIASRYSYISARYVDYVEVTSGETWILTSTDGFGDIYILVYDPDKEYVYLKYENPPGFNEGERLLLPDVTLPQESVQWTVAPPETMEWFIRCALYPDSEY